MNEGYISLNPCCELLKKSYVSRKVESYIFMDFKTGPVWELKLHSLPEALYLIYIINFISYQLIFPSLVPDPAFMKDKGLAHLLEILGFLIWLVGSSILTT